MNQALVPVLSLHLMLVPNLPARTPEIRQNRSNQTVIYHGFWSVEKIPSNDNKRYKS